MKILRFRLWSLVFFQIFFALLADAQQWGDYYFYSVQNSNKAYLLNNSGATYHTWTFSSANPTGYSSYMLPGGDILRTVKYTPNSFSGGGQTGKLQKVDFNGNVIWDFVYSTTSYAMHHDICPMPNGNVLLISYELKTAAEATQAGCSQNITIWSEKIVEVKQTGPTTGEIVWEWHLWDHLVQNHDPSKDNYVASISDHPERLNINYKTTKDWIHMNGVDYNPVLDQITFSSHNLNEIYVIDHSTTINEAAGSTGGISGKGGDFLYRWGNPQAYGMSGTAILNVVHDAHWIPERSINSGRLVAFNNRGVSSNKSSVDQIVPPLNGFGYERTAGAPFQPLSYTERHACNGGSNSMGGSQQLPNGNMLVCIATSGLVYETNAAGTTIWSKTMSGTVPKAYKYNDCYLQGTALPVPEITQNNNMLTSTSADIYQWYFMGQKILGAASQTYTPTQTGYYSVMTSNSSDCIHNYSRLFYFDYSTSLPVVDLTNDVKVMPNPSDGRFFIKTSYAISEIRVTDLAGREILILFNEHIVDLTGHQAGVYLGLIKTTNGNVVKKFVRN